MRKETQSIRAISALCLLPALASVTLAGPNSPPGPPKIVPARELTATQLANLMAKPDLQEIAWSSLNIKTAAAVSASAISAGQSQDVDRGSNAPASAYTGLSAEPIVDNGDTAPPFPGDTGQYYDFKDSKDASQAWALMTAEGRPFLSIQNFGQASSSASASWRTQFNVTGSYDQQVYLQFPVPAVLVTGTNEQDGPSLWRSRFRVELQLNGYPVWSSDVMRYNELFGDYENARHLSVFGNSLGHVDSGFQDDGSNHKRVVLFLGRFAPGTQLDVVALYIAENRVETACTTMREEFFCSRGTVTTTPISDSGLVGIKYKPKFMQLEAYHYPSPSTTLR